MIHCVNVCDRSNPGLGGLWEGGGRHCVWTQSFSASDEGGSEDAQT